SQKQSQDLTSNLGVLEITRKELEKQVGSLKEQSQREATDLKTHLKEAENRVHSIQQEYADTQNKLSELKVTFEKTEQEKQTMVEELKQCKENLKLLQEKGNNQTSVSALPTSSNIKCQSYQMRLWLYRLTIMSLVCPLTLLRETVALGDCDGGVGSRDRSDAVSQPQQRLTVRLLIKAMYCPPS
ncbi:hypothetical protein AB205_0073990, partial [Aquarana catesbeiana]